MKDQKERPPAKFFDVEDIARVLEAPANEKPGGGAVELVLENELLGLTLRLCLDEDRRLASVYVRGKTAFLGFLALGDITEVRLRPPKGEVEFMGSNHSTTAYSV